MGIMSAKFREKMQKIKTGVVRTGLVVFILGIAVTAVACSDKTGNQDLDQNNGEPGIENPVDGTQTPSTPSTPDVPVTPDVPDVPVTPDVPDQPDVPDVPDIPDEPTTPDIPDVPVTPEKTEAEYKVECEEIIAEKIENLILQYTGSDTVEMKDFAFNVDNGKIFAHVEDTFRGYTSNYFYTISTGAQNYDTYREAAESLGSKEFKVEERQSNLKMKVSEEKYNALCEYVLGEVGLEGAEVLNATQFKSIGTTGMNGTTLTVLKNNKIYNIQANAHSGTQSTTEGKIEYMLNSSTNEIEITNEENFEDFDSIGISLENLSFEQEIDG